MKKLILGIAVVLCLQVPAFATAFAYVDSKIAQSSNTTSVTTATMDSSTGNLAIIGEVHQQGVTATITDSKGNTPTCKTLYSSAATGTARICYVPSSGTFGSGHTFTSTCGAACFPSIVAEIWNNSSATPSDQDNGAGVVSGGSSNQFGVINPVEDNELAIGVVSNIRNENWSIDSGYTIRQQAQIVSSFAYGIALADKVQTTAAALNPTWTLPVSSFFDVSGANASFKNGAGAGGGGGGVKNRRSNSAGVGSRNR